MSIAQKNIAPFDIDAQRFILATALTRWIDKTAINYLVQGLKANNLWTKMNAIYPMVGGNQWSCKLNLKNPINSDLAYRLTFVASPTISYMGVDWNGTSQYAKTALVANILSASSNHLSYYSRENTQANTILDIGANGANNNFIVMCCGRSLDNLIFYEQGSYYANVASAVISRAGFFIGTRTVAGATNPLLYRNGVSIGTAITADGSSANLPAFEIYIGCQNNNGSPTTFSNRQCAFASIGSGLSAADAFNLNSIVQQFQIILQRAV